MKNKNGFTLVEIIAVIVILITISLMAVPAVLKTIKRNKEVAYDAKVEIILKQAKQYALDNENFLFDSTKKYIGKVCNNITVKQLLDAGYLKEIASDGTSGTHVVDPSTNEYMDDSNIIVYINSKKPSDVDKRYIGGYVSLLRSDSWCTDASDVATFSYTGSEQVFTASQSGYYRIQVWGAQGGNYGTISFGGKGGYAEGIIGLTSGEELYVYVGGSGDTGGVAGGWNGGGAGVNYNGGGGATDVRIEGHTLYHRLIVAGGGGSAGRDDVTTSGGLHGGAGGGIDGLGNYYATQTTAGRNGEFGIGGYADQNCGGIDGSGGGGWYGGGAGYHTLLCMASGGAGGGSGFAYDGTNVVPEGYEVINHVLTSTLLLSGASNRIPTYDNGDTMTGNTGDGYAAITYVGQEL